MPSGDARSDDVNVPSMVLALMLAATPPGVLSSLDAATSWINSPPLHASDLRGKVVLVDVWTYSCINWRRSSVYVRAWAQTYRKAGLVVVGVHAPEFPFERDRANVAEAVRAIGIDYPVVMDNDFAVWRALGNQYWPAQYLIDAQGRVGYRHVGEGDERATEDAIRGLLSNRGTLRLDAPRAAIRGLGVEAPADWGNVRTPETYVGVDRAVDFASPGGARPGVSRRYSIPAGLSRNAWAASGDWTFDAGHATADVAHAALALHFHARDLHLVMGPAARGAAIRFRIHIDGREPGAAHGGDVDARGYGTIVESRLYHLIRQAGRIEDRRFEIEFLDPNANVYSFTFG